MKSYLFLFFGLLMFFGSCKKDPLTNLSPSDSKTEVEVRGKNGRGALDRVQKVSNWLKFKDQAHYDQVYAFLEQVRENPANYTETRILVEDKNDGYGPTLDPNPLIADIEDLLGIETLRKDALLQEDGILRDGGTPKELNNIQVNDITSTSAKTLHSKDFVIQIGDQIIKTISTSLKVVVNNNNVGLMEDIINLGIEEIYEEENIGDVDLVIKHDKRGPRSDFPCTGAFAALPGGNLDSENKTAGKTFLWNNGDASGAKNLKLDWDFGDGSTATTSGPQTFHKYENLQPHPAENIFNVCVTATYIIEKAGSDEGEVIEVPCVQSTCQQISIKLEEVDEPENKCDELTYALTAAGLLGLEGSLVTFLGTPGNGEEVCAATTNLFNALLAYSLVDEITEISWTFQGGQTSTEFSPCFEVACDGNYLYTIQFKFANGEVCTPFTEIYPHEINSNCQGNNDIQKGWESQYYQDNGNDLYIRWRAKHETENDDGIFESAPNQVEAEMKHYIYNVAQQKWKCIKLGSTIHFDGNIYPSGESCDCAGIADFMDWHPTTNGVRVHHFERNFLAFPDDDVTGIFCLVNDPYTVTFEPDYELTSLYQHVVSFPND